MGMCYRDPIATRFYQKLIKEFDIRLNLKICAWLRTRKEITYGELDFLDPHDQMGFHDGYPQYVNL